MKIERPENDGNDIPSLVPTGKSMERSSLAIGVMLILLFIIGSCALLYIFTFYDKYFGVPEYIPHYITLRDNLKMPDGRTYWDNNNQTDMLMAAKILEEDMNHQIAERNQSSMTIEEFISKGNSRGIEAGPSYGGGISG